MRMPVRISSGSREVASGPRMNSESDRARSPDGPDSSTRASLASRSVAGAEGGSAKARFPPALALGGREGLECLRQRLRASERESRDHGASTRAIHPVRDRPDATGSLEQDEDKAFDFVSYAKDTVDDIVVRRRAGRG